jgi:hypothetical protein
MWKGQVARMKGIRNYLQIFSQDLKEGENLKEKGVDEGIILNGP